MTDRLQPARDSYKGYEPGDREAMESLAGEDLVFYSLPDPDIDRQAYFERCWPNAETIKSFEFIRLFERGDEVFVTYERTTSDGRRFRNTEGLTVDGQKIAKVEVYFGWDIEPS